MVESRPTRMAVPPVATKTLQVIGWVPVPQLMSKVTDAGRRCLPEITLLPALAMGTALADNASNPLAAVNNIDLRAQYFDLGGPERKDYYVDGAYMATPKLKLKYELHYWDTDVTGSSESDWESFVLKPRSGGTTNKPRGVVQQNTMQSNQEGNSCLHA